LEGHIRQWRATFRVGGDAEKLQTHITPASCQGIVMASGTWRTGVIGILPTLTLPHYCNFEISVIFAYIDFEIRVIMCYLCTC